MKLERRVLLGLTAFSAITALAGGIALLIWRNGGRYFPLQLLEHTPFSSFVVPGILLTFFVGGTSLGATWLTWRSSHFSADSTLFAGGALSVWILAESAMMRTIDGLHVLYGCLGVATLWLGVRAAWRTKLLRHRWIVSVTVAEALGFLAPTCVGVLSTQAGLGELAQTVLITIAGGVEGLVLGAGQALALPFPLRRGRYALLTALGAGFVWLSVMGTMLLVGGGDHSPLISLSLGLATGFVGLAVIGSVQWLELRKYAPRAHLWIGWTALAWAMALPLSFSPGPFVDEFTPAVPNLLLWACGGLLMAYVMALVTWQGVRRLTEDLPSH